MDYKEMSNEELYQLLREKFPGAGFKKIAKDNRQTVIAILEIHQDEKQGGKTCAEACSVQRYGKTLSYP